MSIYRVRHVIFDQIVGTDAYARETVRELFFGSKEDAEKSISLYLNKAKEAGRKFTEDAIEINSLTGHYFEETDSMVSLDEIQVFERSS